MPFLGTTPTQGFVGANPKQSFTANGSTTVFTLTNPVASANDLEVFVGNVRQEPTAAYTAAGTTLTMSEAPDTGLNFYVINKSQAQVTTTPPVNSISTDKIVNDAVTGAKIENNPTIAGNLAVAGTTTLNADTTLSKSGAAQLKVMTTDDNTFAQVLIQDVNAGYSWQVRSDNAQSTTDGALLLNDQRGTFPIIIDENNATNTFKLSNSVYTGKLILSGNSPGSFAFGNHATWTNAIDLSGQPQGSTIKASISMQNNSLYSACIYIFKTQNSHYFQVGYANNSGLQLRISGTYIQTYQNSGANQTGSGGSARVYLGGGIT